MQNIELRGLVVDSLEDMKAIEVQCLDVSTQSDFADFMFVAGGSSNRHVRAVAGSVIEHAKQQGIVPLGVEGMADGEWVLIDLVDVVVHVMLPATRAFYDLERLWSLSPSTTSHG
ncbi:MAG: ribosome silencing factor [Gammaproteobacteria bacterium]|uniref:Ribosomal silencing factor RsfS n=1 Tax=OM182 bacterium MED-G24 TaxID=1986255 RepID=A0A2A5WT68_9GAMM|nr:ribosome silencing factor [Gammaproteobacteria bacterium]PDH39427.1 MAG: ribosome silencing factor [OM182 bacterium MED-G24]|tara:strand:+ start:2436 stop:2780 length:345 start_codon:yes stop_codon:yes gene_type:complete